VLNAISLPELVQTVLELVLHRDVAYSTHNVLWLQVPLCHHSDNTNTRTRWLQELIRRWDSERELFYDDIAHVLQNTKKNYFV